MIYILLFIVGCCLGSFAYCFSADWVNQQIRWTRRSSCDHCQRTLGILDLIPIVSQLTTAFRCRYCKESTSYFYSIVEFLSGCLLIWAYWIFPTMPFWFTLVFTLITLLIIFCDIHSLYVPDILQVGLFLLLVIYVYSGNLLVLSQFYLLLSTLIALMLITLIRPGSLGGADIKALSILALGIPLSLFPLFILLTSLFALVFIIGRFLVTNSYQEPIPFLPFILLSFYCVLSII